MGDGALGRPFVRTPEGTEELKPMDVVFFPRGPEGAHQIGNRTDEPARVLMWSDVDLPERHRVPRQRQGRRLDGLEPEDLIVERSSGVDYYKGESA